MLHPAAILCIDDNVLTLAIRKAILESRDYRVFTAGNGIAGLEIVNREPIDVVILDYNMPEMDGGTVAEEIHSKHPDVPILLLSGFPSKIPESVLSIVDGFIYKGVPLPFCCKKCNESQLQGDNALNGFHAYRAIPKNR